MVFVIKREALGQGLEGVRQHLPRQRDLAVALPLLGHVGNAGKHHPTALELDDPQIAIGPEFAAVDVLQQRLAILDGAVAHEIPADFQILLAVDEMIRERQRLADRLRDPSRTAAWPHRSGR